MTNRTDAGGWTGRLAVMSIAAAIAVSVIYLPQSMLSKLASSLGVGTGTASIIATAVQVGYAAGIFFLVPLSERVQPRRQITVQTIVLFVALVATAIVRVWSVLLLASSPLVWWRTSRSSSFRLQGSSHLRGGREPRRAHWSVRCSAASSAAESCRACLSTSSAGAGCS